MPFLDFTTLHPAARETCEHRVIAATHGMLVAGCQQPPPRAMWGTSPGNKAMKQSQVTVSHHEIVRLVGRLLGAFPVCPGYDWYGL
jgi:hypothetical protein